MYVCVYVYVYEYVYNMHMPMFIYICICIYVYVYLSIYLFIYIYTQIFKRANISVLMYVSANRAEISIRALCGSSSVLCRHLVPTPFGSKWLLCFDLVLENKRAYFRFGGHLLEIHSNSYENQGATSGANKRKRAQISATGRKIKKCSF